MTPLKLDGIIPATVLPMTANYEIDEDALKNYMKWILKFEIVGLAINVDTGEGPHLYNNEKMKVLRIVKNVVGNKVPIIAGLQGDFTAHAIKTAKETKDRGADAFLVFPITAFFGSPLNPEVPYAYHKAIADSVNLPMILFQLQPALGGVEYSPDALKKLIEIEEIIAIKEASFNANTYVRTLNFLKMLPRQIIPLTGNDNFIFESFVLGCEGALIGFGTLATDLQVEMVELFKIGQYEEAREIGARVQALADVIFAPPVRNYRARTKEALVQLGVLEHAYMRPPLLPINDREREKVKTALKKAELL